MTPDLEKVELTDILPVTWQLLEAGIKSAADPLHTMCVATLRDMSPEQRTVVLRHADPNDRTLFFHTDARSSKVDELISVSRASWLFYDADRKLQLRFSGEVRLHRDDAVADSRWSAMSANSRACYGATDVPGTKVDSPPEAPPVADSDAAAAQARKNFIAVSCRAERFDWLFLTRAGHRRAQFRWSEHGVESGWIAP